MMRTSGRAFRPEFTAPGGNLRDILLDRDIKVVEFAQRCGRPTKTISEIISGETSITPETALQFERVLVNPNAETWINWEALYRLQLAAIKERQKLVELYDWAKSFPVKDLLERGYIKPQSDKADFVKELLEFLGVYDLDSWSSLSLGQERAVTFRKAKKHKGDDRAIAAWLRIGSKKAQEIESPKYDEKILKSKLPELRSLTLLDWEELEPRLIETCRECGIALVIEDELPGTRLSGAARWLSKDKPLIQLSRRYAYEDQFWFSFFHEVGHIILHSKKALFIDEDEGLNNEIEAEADRFAENCLLPKKVLDSFYEKYGMPGSRPAPHNKANIREFAEMVGLSPGIVFAQMRRRYPNLYNNGNLAKLIRRIRPVD